METRYSVVVGGRTRPQLATTLGESSSFVAARKLAESVRVRECAIHEHANNRIWVENSFAQGEWYCDPLRTAHIRGDHKNAHEPLCVYCWAELQDEIAACRTTIDEVRSWLKPLNTRCDVCGDRVEDVQKTRSCGNVCPSCYFSEDVKQAETEHEEAQERRYEKEELPC